ncbi:synaptobrevin [Lindgomyces ingoldianus]|uniref:Synaptobrevin n=1 Tax=Lindgomyces ingoldianus TaxID=673940 RepID=A0ACB6R1R2_9PLEO|nr:synaptobrevin [Lindgomyces ingoldianus]KAF2473025.1 synaptobrevin [Lindgomyces ingoldianus]
MKIWYIGIVRNEAKPVFELAGVDGLDAQYNRWVAPGIREIMKAYVTTIAERIKPGERDSVREKDYLLHYYVRPEGICGIVVTDLEYKKGPAHKILSQTCDEFLTQYPRSTWPLQPTAKQGHTEHPYDKVLKEYLGKFQDPLQADSMLKIQHELDETKMVLNKTIQSVLERGEKIEDLVAKSDGLSAQSKMFYTQARKQNSCCAVM